MILDYFTINTICINWVLSYKYHQLFFKSFIRLLSIFLTSSFIFLKIRDYSENHESEFTHSLNQVQNRSFLFVYWVNLVFWVACNPLVRAYDSKLFKVNLCLYMIMVVKNVIQTVRSYYAFTYPISFHLKLAIFPDRVRLSL